MSSRARVPCRIGLVALLLTAPWLVVPAPTTRADEDPVPKAWAWLEASAPADGVHVAPTVESEEARRARGLLLSVLPLTLAPRGVGPEGTPPSGAAVVLRSDGLLAASWQVLSQASGHRWLWARGPRGRWWRVIPTGGTWWGDVGLGRLVAVRRRWTPIEKAVVTKRDLGRPYLGIGTAWGRAPVVNVGELQALVLFDPDERSGRRLVDRTWKEGATAKAPVIALHLEGSLAGAGSAGSPVFDAETGRCVGLVSRAGLRRGRQTVVLVRPWAYLDPFLENMQREATFNPPDLGVRWGPNPDAHGDPCLVPPALTRVREKVPGGLLVEFVMADGPANKNLWEGDVVLEIEGRPVFAEVYESRALAMMALFPGVPTDLVVLRGGERKDVQVMTKRARDLYVDFDREHEIRAGGLR